MIEQTAVIAAVVLALAALVASAWRRDRRRRQEAKERAWREISVRAELQRAEEAERIRR